MAAANTNFAVICEKKRCRFNGLTKAWLRFNGRQLWRGSPDSRVRPHLQHAPTPTQMPATRSSLLPYLMALAHRFAHPLCRSPPRVVHRLSPDFQFWACFKAARRPPHTRQFCTTSSTNKAGLRHSRANLTVVTDTAPDRQCHGHRDLQAETGHPKRNNRTASGLSWVRG